MQEERDEQINTEQWRSVKGYEGQYEVSDRGRVRSLPRVSDRPISGAMRLKGRMLKPRPLKAGHVQVNLCADGGRKNQYIHRMVAQAFIGDPPTPRAEVRHLNGVPSDNRVENLAWGTRSENNYDRRRHGVDHEVNKTHCSRGHPLASPNLRADMARQGHRGCLACNRAWAYVSYHGLGKEAMQAVSDDYYAQIIQRGSVASIVQDE